MMEIKEKILLKSENLLMILQFSKLNSCKAVHFDVVFDSTLILQDQKP